MIKHTKLDFIECAVNKKPIQVFGVPFFKEKDIFERLPQEFESELTYPETGRRTPGARIAFRTNSNKVKVKITLNELNLDVHMSIFAAQSACVLIGERKNPSFIGVVNPSSYDENTFENIFEKNNKMEDVTIFLPRNEFTKEVKIYIEEGSQIEEATPYEYGPVLFYGSSITEGGCAGRVVNAYTALLSNKLDFDYYNFGFSGSATGQLKIADYINKMDIKCFVYDYDHNAPDCAHLKETHEAFFRRIREANPDIPIIIMSKPDFEGHIDNKKRRDIVYKTYENAIKLHDNNVYFIDGEKMFGKEDRCYCTVDGCHPNDLGFYRMAKTIEPIMKTALGIV